MTKSSSTAYPDLSADQRATLVAATSLYCKHLEAVAKEAKDLGKDTDAASYETEAEQLKADTALRLQQDTPQLRPHEVKAIERGLSYFLKNLRAAKGTVRGLGKEKLADDFELEAQAIEAELLPNFREQTALKV